jgi:hypothetical protein
VGKAKAKMIKVSADEGREWLWATRINRRVVKVENIPTFTSEFTLGDLVEINEDREIVGVVERCGWTYHGLFDADGTRDEVWRRWLALCDHLRKYDIFVDAVAPGIFSMAVPLDVDDGTLSAIAVASPVPFELLR